MKTPKNQINLDASYETGLVCEIQKTSINVLTQANQTVFCSLDHAVFPKGTAAFAIGDRVSWQPTGHEQGMIRMRHPRHHLLTRPRTDGARWGQSEEHILAANIDLVVITASAARPAFKPRFIDRYQVICQRSQIPAVICINKVDLVKTPPDLAMFQELGIPVIYASVLTGSGLDELTNFLKGKIAVFTGHSGVGKSSLVNALLDSDARRIGPVHENTGKGKHTTVSSTLQPLSGGGYIIDTPGIRTLGLGEMQLAELLQYFPEFDRVTCRFNNCRHQQEPGCGVLQAVKSGRLPAGRYESYLRLAAEVKR